jgi:putative restriction endonuclease
MPTYEDDQALRRAAFDHVRRLTDIRGDLTSADLRTGFQFRGERVPIINPQRGIFKPQRMQYLLSIRTVFPRSGARVWYDDQRQVHRQIYEGVDAVEYAFMGHDSEAADNRWLREALDAGIPIIYFLGVAPGSYQAIVPAYIGGWDAASLKARVVFGMPGELDVGMPETGAERRYALREVKQRLHQASFREAVIHAYDGRCALSGLPEPLLLDAAHIVSDGDILYGQPIVTNGIPLSKIHHAAFDSHLIGIDADYRIHIADRLMRRRDGPLLEALKGLHREKVHLPARTRDFPDRDRLAARFRLFQESAVGE